MASTVPLGPGDSRKALKATEGNEVKCLRFLEPLQSVGQVLIVMVLWWLHPTPAPARVALRPKTPRPANPASKPIFIGISALETNPAHSLHHPTVQGVPFLSALLQTWPVRSTILLVEDDPFPAYARKSVLERHFPRVERVADLAEAFIRVDEPDYARRLALVIVALHQPGMAGPAFVSELAARLHHVPILVVGRSGEIASDYPGELVRFLPQHAPTNQILQQARQILAHPPARIA